MRATTKLGILALATLGALTAGCSSDSARESGAEQSASQAQSLTSAQASLAKWGGVLPLSLVPVSVANLPDGKVLMWAADDPFNFSTGGITYSLIFDPQTGTSVDKLVTETGHDMFCPGTAILTDGRVLINGGVTSWKTTIYNPATGAWTAGADMNIARGYQGTTPLADRSVFTLGGSWSGGVGNKHGEVWDEATGWRKLSGVLIDPFLSQDDTRSFGGDSHFWLLPAGNGRVFHAGPGVAMHWIETERNGRVIDIGPRGDDEFSINGNAVVYDTGKVLKVGGGPGYDGKPANGNSYVMDVGTSVTVRKIGAMAYHRSFQNSVPLPNGQVIVIGGATVGVGFSDDNSVLIPEIFDPVTEAFLPMAPMSVPRNYHSVALLLPDGRVLSGGGGLCGSGCGANHADIQLLSPPYLFNANGTPATRPVIVTAPSAANHGTSITVTTDSVVSSFALVRLSATTHTVNNDQRRLAVTFQNTATNTYSVQIPSNTGWALPGPYMLFAMNAQGTPSMAKTIRVGSPTLLHVKAVGEQSSPANTNLELSLQYLSQATGALTFSAVGLPPGLLVDAATGLIHGSPTTPGNYVVEAKLSDGSQTVSTQFPWAITVGGGGTAGNTRYVRLEALTELNGNQWSSAAELNVLGPSGTPLPRADWIVTTDSAQSGYGVQQAIDGNTATMWHSQWDPQVPVPHWVVFDLGTPTTVTGLKYLPRQDGNGNGLIGQYRISVSTNGVSWGTPVATGDFATFAGTAASEKTVMFGGAPTPTNHAPVVQQPTPTALTVGTAASFTLQASDADGDTLNYAATGLPAGLSVNAGSGLISGTPSAAGTSTVNVSVTDGKGGTGSAQFFWVVNAQSGGGGGTGPTRYVMLKALSEVGGNIWSSGAELNLLGGTGQVLSRTGWTATADSFETGYGPANLLDGNSGSLWHTRWSSGGAVLPHWVKVDLGSAQTITGLKLLPRSGTPNGVIGDFEIYVSSDGVSWGSPVAQGDFADMGPMGSEKTVTFATGGGGNPTPTNHAPTAQQPTPAALTVAVATTYTLQASDPDGDALTFAATGLPAGLTLNPTSGVITGTPNTAGSYDVNVSVSDGKGGIGTAMFTWVVSAAAPSNHAPVVQQPAPAALTVGTAASFTLQASDADGDTLSYAATGLPAGLSVNAGSGLISGTPSAAGTSTVNVSVTDGKGGTGSAQFFWVVNAQSGGGGGTGPTRYVMLKALSEVGGNIWSSGAELNLLGGTGQVLSRTGWTATADSFETGYGPANLLDGNSGSLWHTRWSSGGAVLPHWVKVDLGSAQTITGLKLLPRSGTPNGVIGDFEIYVSSDGVNWGSPVAQGDFADMGPMGSEKTVTFATGGGGNPTPTNHAPTAQQPTPAALTVAVATTYTLQASDPDGDALTFAATGLPAGLTLNPTSGVITGTPNTAGSYDVNVSVSDGKGGIGTAMFTWVVSAPSGGGNPGSSGNARYVMLKALTEVGGNIWSSCAELNLLGADGLAVSRAGWVASVDSAEAGYAASAAIDGNNASLWHTRWSSGGAALPHWLKVDMGSSRTVKGLKYRPRSDTANGVIGDFEVYLSNDGVTWGSPVAQGDFADMGPVASEKTVNFTLVVPPDPTNHAPTAQQPAPAALLVGQATTLALQASDPDGDPLSFATTGLPPGLTLNPTTGVITGTPTTPGSYDVNVSVSDARGGVGTAQFTWGVSYAAPTVSPVVAPITAQGATASYTVTASGAGTLQYSWDFGDGTAVTAFAAGASKTHVFASAGVYTVTLTVRIVNGPSTTTQFLQGVSTPALASKPKSSSSLALEKRTGLSTRLWVVNIDNNSVSVFDTSSNAKLQEIAVGTSPRTVAVGADGRIWVTNKGDSSLSIINPSTFAVTTVALPRAARPFGIVVRSNNSAYVALEGTGDVLALSSAGAVTSQVNVGSNPRHLALTAAEDKLLVSRFISPFQPGEATAAVQTVVAGVKQGAEVKIITTSGMTVSSTVTLQFSDKADSTVTGRGLPNYLGAPAIAPDGASAWVPSKQDNVQRGTLRDGQALDFQNTVRAVTSRINLSTLTEDYAARVDHDNSGVASAAIYDPSGVYLFVALETSRQVAVLDPARKRELFRLNVGFAPQAVVVSDDGSKLYVNNALSRNVSVFDLTPLMQRGDTTLLEVATLSSVLTEALSASVLRGKQLFYDARDTRLARDAYLSCASCHNDGDGDGRTWDFTGFNEGLRNTISLRGRGMTQGRLHWTANFDEVQDFETQIRTFAQGTGLMADNILSVGTRLQPLGDSKAGLSSDLDALAAYVGSLTSFSPSPYRTATGEPSAEANAGAIVFADKCTSCHGGSGFSDSPSGLLHDVGTIKPTSGKRLGATLTGLDTPTLRDVWATAPYLHDGSAATLPLAVQAHTSIALTATELSSVSAYVQQIGAEEPGFTP